MSDNIVDVVNAMGSKEKANAITREDLKPNIQWHSKRCVKVAAVRPLPRSDGAEESQNHPQSPALTLSPTRTTSDDLSSSPVRVAHEERLERRRLQEESGLPSKFKANPVRKYKPLILQRSSHLPTVPRWPFSHRDPVK